MVDLYDIRSRSRKDDPRNMTAKLQMNSVFGRFGMKPITRIQKFFNNKSLKELMKLHPNIFNIIEVEGTDLSLVDYSHKNAVGTYNCSIGIAALTTAEGIIFMSQFKNNPNYNLLYTDTDSIFIDSDLPEDMVGTELGQFKKKKNTILKKAYS